MGWLSLLRLMLTCRVEVDVEPSARASNPKRQKRKNNPDLHPVFFFFWSLLDAKRMLALAVDIVGSATGLHGALLVGLWKNQALPSVVKDGDSQA
jgi:hypothetical protein